MSTTRYLTVACALALLGRTARADESTDEERDAATRVATNPLPVVKALKFTPGYTWENNGTLYRAELQFEPVLPYDGVLIPGLHVDDIWSILRIQLTAESLQNSNGTASGLENLNLVDVAAYNFGTLAIGAGFGTVFPMATSSALGPAKWQLGPAAVFHWAPAHVLTIAALSQALWSVAGTTDVSDQSYVTLQPFVTLHPYPGLAILSDATMSFYWEGGSTTVPVDLGVGYAFSKHFVATVKFTWTVVGDDLGAFKGELELDFLP